MRAVNLLPADRRKRERESFKFTPLHVAGVGILVGALALGYWGHSIHGQVDVEQAKITDLEAQSQTLTAQIAQVKSKSTSQVSTYDTDKALVSGLAVARVNWSTVMVRLARVAPSGVWLRSLSVTTPTSDVQTAAAATPAAKRPAAITLEASATSRTNAALFVSRLNGIPGFVEPRLSAGITPHEGTDTTATAYDFTVEIPVDDSIFGTEVRPATATTQSTATPTPQP
jgi:Tfp pilus assembly protein PilN